MKAKRPKHFRKLWVWQQGIALTLQIYNLTKHLAPRDDRAVIPLRRAACSIPAKVARGVSMGRGAYVRCLMMAYGATQEIETQLHLLAELRLVDSDAASRVRLLNDDISQTLVNMLMAMPMAPEFEL